MFGLMFNGLMFNVSVPECNVSCQLRQKVSQILNAAAQKAEMLECGILSRCQKTLHL